MESQLEIDIIARVREDEFSSCGKRITPDFGSMNPDVSSLNDSTETIPACLKVYRRDIRSHFNG